MLDITRKTSFLADICKHDLNINFKSMKLFLFSNIILNIDIIILHVLLSRTINSVPINFSYKISQLILILLHLTV
jgi:hypothetical protein